MLLVRLLQVLVLTHANASAPGFAATLLPEVQGRLAHWAQQKDSGHVIVALLSDEATKASARKALAPHQSELPAKIKALLSSQ